MGGERSRRLRPAPARQRDLPLRRFAMVLLLAPICAALALLAPPAWAAEGSVQLERSSQLKILSQNRVTESVVAPRKWRIRTHARVRAARAGAKTVAITKRIERKVKLGTRTIELRLTQRGRKLLKRCSEQKLIVQVRVIGSERRKDLGTRYRAAERLRLDRPRCVTNPAAASPDFAVDPSGAGRHVNGTPRGYTARDLGAEPVTIALFACNKVSGDPEQGFSFVGRGGQARPGAPAGSISSVAGTPQAGAPQQVGPRTAGPGGELELELNGANGCARPVLWSDADSDGSLDTDAAGVPSESFGVGGKVRFEAQGFSPQNAGRCDFLDGSACLHPFPSNHMTVPDSGAATGRRIDFNVLSMPVNRLGVPILPGEHNRADGFSPGSMLITRVPGIDSDLALEASGAVPIDDFGRFDDPDQPIVVIDAATGERHPVWAEIDSNPGNPSDRALLIRPQRNFLEGHRYVVGLRNLKRSDGSAIEAGRAFQLYRDRVITSDPAIEARRPQMESILASLKAAGIGRSELNLAWDFTVASAESTTGRMLAIRDDAFAGLGDTDLADLEVEGASPAFSIVSVENFTTDEDPRIGRRVEGTLTVPCYLSLPLCLPGGQFLPAAGTGLPTRIPGNVAIVSFICNIPHSALGVGAEPARPSLYGHGLLGSAGEVDAGNVKAMAAEHNMLMCATDWAGFSTKDAASIALILQDLNNFPKLADGSQQGFLNFLFLGRALVHQAGLGNDAAFRGADGQSVIDRSRLFYDGNSQGGILGGSLLAVAPDMERGVLGVPGMNYSTLLRRSVDFDGYATGAIFGPDTPFGLYDSYPDELQRPLLLSLVQMLWDRAEANGYAQHMTSDPLPNTPPHEVLLHVAFGDHQVANLTADVMARTIGARTNAPLDEGRFPGADPLFGIPLIENYPYDGSAIVYFDSGSPDAPRENVPPRAGVDPHGHPRNDEAARLQKSDFLRIEGRVIDVCESGPCYANGYTGPGP